MPKEFANGQTKEQAQASMVRIAKRMSIARLERALDSIEGAISEQSRYVYKDEDEYEWLMFVQGVYANEYNSRI